LREANPAELHPVGGSPRTTPLIGTALLTIVLMSTAAMPLIGSTATSIGSASPSATEVMQQLHWISGHWIGDFDGLPFESWYTSPEGGEILSTSKLYSDGKVVLFEFERIHVRDGQVVYTPHPRGRASISFMLEDYVPSQRRARFLNPEHDFPTEVTFESPAPDRLEIVLKGPDGDKGRVQRVTLKQR
jgi:hypothetical protein